MKHQRTKTMNLSGHTKGAGTQLRLAGRTYDWVVNADGKLQAVLHLTAEDLAALKRLSAKLLAVTR